MFAMAFQVCFFASASDVCFQCFICHLLYVASVASVFKSRSGCLTYCNGVSSVCPKYFIYFRLILQIFYLNVTKIDLVLHML